MDRCIAGAGLRTVAAARRAVGLGQERRFERYQRVLNRVHWSGLRGAGIVLGQRLRLLPADWPVTVAIDEALERRQGARILATGMYPDGWGIGRGRPAVYRV